MCIISHLLWGQARGVGILVGGLRQRLPGGEGLGLPHDVLQLGLPLLGLVQLLGGVSLLLLHLLEIQNP